MIKINDPYLIGPHSFKNKILRFLWKIFYFFLFRFSPRPLFFWRSFLLKCFGATIGKSCHIYPSAKIWAPWNLFCQDVVCIGDNVNVYNPAPVYINSHAIISQDAFICTATHDYNSKRFSLIKQAITINSYAWICAKASILPGINIGVGAILGLNSVATHDLDEWSVYAGNPAVKIKKRLSI